MTSDFEDVIRQAKKARSVTVAIINPTLGYQPPHRYHGRSGGKLKFHATGCRVDGGEGLPRGVCRKCVEGVLDDYWRGLKRLEQQTGDAA